LPSIYKIIRTEKQLDRVISYCKQTGYASVDFETTGHPYHSSLGLPTILGISFQAGSAWILPLAHFDSPFLKGQKWVYLLNKFGKEVIENPKVTKIAQNLKFEYKWFKKYGITMRGRLFDTMLAKYLIKEEKPIGLKSMVAELLPEFANYQEDYEGHKLPWDEKPLEGLSKYCGLDCDLTFRIMINWEPLLIKHKFYALFRNMMMMGVRVLGDSEYAGMPVNRKYLKDLVETYQEKIAVEEKALYGNKAIKKFEVGLIKTRIEKYIGKIEDEIEELEKVKSNSNDPVIRSRKERGIIAREERIDRIRARDFGNKKEIELGAPVNFGSPPQMIEFLYTHKMGLKLKVLDRTETGNPSTAEETLLKLKAKDKSGFIDHLLELRGLSKLYSTYVIGIYNKLSEEDRIHARFLLEGTVTGRLSSRDPNLQNIPRDTTAPDIKPMFVPPKGMVLMQLDYSQAELRVMAAQAGETNMIQWFKDGRDIHLAVACKKNDWEYDWALPILIKEDGKDPDYFKVKTQRKFAKTINFGIIYGQTAKKLAVSLECSEREAKAFLRQYNKDFPMISKFIAKQYRLVEEYGYVKNVFGRKRRLPNIDSPKWHEKAEAQRQSVNAPIQGAASDYTLFSSILIWEQIQKGNLPKTIQQAYTVHDSLGYFMYPKDLKKAIPIMNKICENPETQEWFNFQIDGVTMKVDFEVSAKNWGSLKTYHEETDYTRLVA